MHGADRTQYQTPDEQLRGQTAAAARSAAAASTHRPQPDSPQDHPPAAGILPQPVHHSHRHHGDLCIHVRLLSAMELGQAV